MSSDQDLKNAILHLAQHRQYEEGERLAIAWRAQHTKDHAEWVRVTTALALLYEKWDKLPKAEQHYLEICQVAPDHRGVHFGLIKISLALGNFDQAQERAAKALNVKEIDKGLVFLLYAVASMAKQSYTETSAICCNVLVNALQQQTFSDADRHNITGALIILKSLKELRKQDKEHQFAYIDALESVRNKKIPLSGRARTALKNTTERNTRESISKWVGLSVPPYTGSGRPIPSS